jgi:hypothetical protein
MDDVDVGTTFVNTQIRRATTLTNSGPGAFVPASVSTTSSAFAVSGGTCQVGVPVAAGESCSVELMFVAPDLGAINSQLVVSEQGVGAVRVAAAISGSGGVPKMEADPATVIYADALVGAGAESLSVVIRNVGAGPMVVSTVVIGGTHPADFAMDSDACSARGVPEQGACVVRVVFNPTTSGVRTAVVILTAADGSVARATLSGRGYYSPTLSVTPNAVEAGSRVVLAGAGFPGGVDVTAGWEGRDGMLVRTATDGTFTLVVETSGIAAGLRALLVADSVPPGATPRFEPLRSPAVQLAEQVGGLDATSPVFDEPLP